MCQLTISEAGRLLRTKELSPVELTRAFLTRIEAVDSLINSYITVTAAEALSCARACEAELHRGDCKGPLHGIPYGLKDIFLTSGIKTTAASRTLLEYIPTEDAEVYARLKRAGAVLLGKLNTFEFGMGVGTASFDLPFPPARNPWDLERFTGSTSTGAGVAVAARTAMGAFGTDTGGSVRLPAAACGVLGLKPTYGRVSRRNIIPNAYSLDHVGPIAASVEDAAILLQAVAGFDPYDPSSADCEVPDFREKIDSGIHGLRIGVIRRFHTRDASADPSISAAIEAAVSVLRQLGAEVFDIEPSASLLDYRACMKIINTCESYAAHRETFRRHYEKLGEGFRQKMMSGIALSASDYINATRWRNKLATELTELIAPYDAVVCAGTMAPAPLLRDATAVSDFTGSSAMAAFNLSGHPALSICIGFTPDGLPLNMQIAARHFDETTLIRVARAYEAATPWRSRRPPI